MDKKLQAVKVRQEEIFKKISDILGGLSAPVRIKLIHFLSQAPLTVEVLAQKIDQSIANTSMHLRKMLAENLVSVEVVGQKRLYSLHPSLREFWEQIQTFSQFIHPNLDLNLNQYYEELSWDEDKRTTIDLAKNGDILILDVRPIDEAVEKLDDVNFLHIPSSEIKEKLNLLPKRKPVVVICRGRFCALSAHVVSELRKNGIKAYRFEESLFELKKIKVSK